MADSTTSKLNLSRESIQVAPAAEDGSLTHITFMDPKLYEAAADGDIHVLEKYDIHVQLTPKRTQFSILKPNSQPNEKGDTPLHPAAREGHLTVVKNLIDDAKQLQEGDTEKRGTIICKAMLRMTNEDNDTTLPRVPYGANTEGNTSLYIVADWGFGDLVQIILDNCSSPAHSGINGRTALHASVILNHQAMTKKILEWKSALTKELDKNGWSPLHFAAYVGCHPTIVTQLLEKSDTTALHIAASRGHVEIVKLLVSHFPDCCEKVDDEGNNVLHLIMPEKIFLTSGLSNIPWLRVRGLTYEKNGKGKTPSIYFTTRRKRSSRIVSTRPLGSLEIREDSGSSKSEEISERKESEEISESKESKEISEIKKTMKSHMIVAALIATVTFAAGFTLPGGYIQNESNNQGLAVLSLPTNGTKGKDRDMAIVVRENFRIFVMADGIAMLLSMCAISIYFFASFPIKNKKVAQVYLFCGYALTMSAMIAMVFAFVAGLGAVLYPSSLLEGTTTIIPWFFFLLFLVPMFLTLTPNPVSILYGKNVKSYTLM
ncbi:hypothetical protein AAG906_013125 [Vitis piasezkii]